MNDHLAATLIFVGLILLIGILALLTVVTKGWFLIGLFFFVFGVFFYLLILSAVRGEIDDF